jgi:hypothetical protein
MRNLLKYFLRKGNQLEAEKRIKASENLPILAESTEIMALAEKYFSKLNIPEKSKYDTLHIAYASCYEVEYLLSWNMKHISNPRTQSALIDLNLELNLKTPLRITPEALMEDLIIKEVRKIKNELEQESQNDLEKKISSV